MLRPIVRALALIAFLLVPAEAWANACVCTPGTTCTTAVATNWTSCGGTFPGAGDSFTVPSTATVNLDANWTVLWGDVQSGGTLAKSVNGSVTLTFAGASAFTVGEEGGGSGSRYLAFWCRPGATCTLSKVGESSPQILAWSGDLTTACGGGACPTHPSVGFLFGQIGDVADPVNDAIVRWRGISRNSTAILWFSEGATTGAANFVDCVKMATVATSTPQVGDTVVFTSGRSTGYWARVSARPNSCVGAGNPDAHCTGVNATTECSAVACGGGTCDMEIERASTGTGTGSTGATWSSFVKATGRDAGNARHATPDDANADGTADSTNTLPQNGDTIEIFLPAVLKGGANAYINGPSIVMGGVQANLRYLEWARVGASSGECTADSTYPAVLMDRIKATNPEGDGIRFVNEHDFAGRQSNEWGKTDDSADSRPNYPVTADFWYIHDADASPETCNGGGVTNQSHLGGGTKIYLPNLTDTETANGLTLRHHHYARLYAPAFIGASVGHSPRNTIINNTYQDFMLHDIPKNNTFPDPVGTGGAASTNAMFNENVCHDCLAEGIMLWDIGTPKCQYGSIGIRTIAERSGHCSVTTSLGCDRADGVGQCPNTPPQETCVGATRDSSRVSNAYVVNIDLKVPATNMTVLTGANLARATGFATSIDTSNVTISNSYMSNVVGAAGAGGSWYYNYIHNVGLSVSGGPCSTARTAAVFWPEDFVGNVVYRDLSTSCYAFTLSYDHGTASSDTSCIYTGRRRKIMSNVLLGPLSNASNGASVIFYRTNSASSKDLCGWDISNNILDLQDSVSTSTPVIQIANMHGLPATCSANGNCPPINVVSNIIGGATAPGAQAITANQNSGATLTNAYNTFFRVWANPPVVLDVGSRSLQTGEIDIDGAPWSESRGDNFWSLPCSSTERTRAPTGIPVGPLRFGINSFDHFHPAALATFSADAFSMRYNWLQCRGANQDAVRR